MNHIHFSSAFSTIKMILLGILICSPAIASELESDRPDFTEGTNTVEQGRFQIEAGYTYTEDSSRGITSKSHVFPELLLRAGLNDSLELRLAWEGYSSDKTGGEQRVKGASDMSVGFKLRIIDDAESDFALSVLGDLSIPIGATNQSSDKVLPGIGLLMAYDLNTESSIASNVNFATIIDDDDRQIFEPSASLTFAHLLTNSVGTYLEYFAFFPANSSSNNSEHYGNTGLTILLTEDVQLDFRVGIGLNNEADNFFAGSGLAIRI